MTGDAPQRRHIIFVGGTSEPGGLHIHTAEVAQACAALGHRVTIFCPSINYFDGLIYDPRVIVEQPVAPVRWMVRELVLVHSHYRRSRHVSLAQWPLNGWSSSVH